MRRDAQMLQALQQLPCAPTVYLGGNPIATQLGLHKLQMQHSRSEPGELKLLAGSDRPAESIPRRQSMVSKSTTRCSSLKLHKHGATKLTLGQSLRSSLHMATSNGGRAAPQQLTFDGLDHAKLDQVFGRLQLEIDSWKSMAAEQKQQAEKVDEELATAAQAECAQGAVRFAALSDDMQKSMGMYACICGVPKLLRTRIDPSRDVPCMNTTSPHPCESTSLQYAGTQCHARPHPISATTTRHRESA